MLSVEGHSTHVTSEDHVSVAKYQPETATVASNEWGGFHIQHKLGTVITRELATKDTEDRQSDTIVVKFAPEEGRMLHGAKPSPGRVGAHSSKS